MKKMYFIAEAIIGGQTLQSERTNILYDEKRGEIFADVFSFTEIEEVEQYTDKEDLMATLFGTYWNYFEQFGEIANGEIRLMAAEEHTNIVKWGLKFNALNDDEFQYATLDFRNSNTVLRFQEN